MKNETEIRLQIADLMNPEKMTDVDGPTRLAIVGALKWVIDDPWKPGDRERVVEQFMDIHRKARAI